MTVGVFPGELQGGAEADELLAIAQQGQARIRELEAALEVANARHRQTQKELTETIRIADEAT
ncbi:MAG TPA: hypothetical protein VFU02_17175, partial [Polyangiaceae bacterium]|nr:hypothetical protein [Polyangiaceae bacterium]